MQNFMHQAIKLAKKGKRNTAPNPCVGAVIVKDNQILAKGYHTKFGSQHAEVEAINDAKNKNIDITNATMYVTLEPCNHYGKTPPCTKAIIDSGIKKVFIGTLDPNPNVKGGGAKFLQENGVLVHVGLEEKACLDLIEDFLIWTRQSRPFVRLKMATTLDGKIATRYNHSAFISCEESRQDVHKMRKLSDAIIVGENTFFHDNPKLTARVEGDFAQPKAIIFNENLDKINLKDFYLTNKRPNETIFITNSEQKNSKKAYELENIGCKITVFKNLKQSLKTLFMEEKIHYLLCEGGGFLANKLIKEGLVDEFIQYIAPISLGDEKAVSLFSGEETKKIQDGVFWDLQSFEPSGKDIKLTLKPKKD